MIIDADVHVIEPADLWTSRLPAKYGELCPRVRYREDLDQDWWFIGDSPVYLACPGDFLPEPDENGRLQRREDNHNYEKGRMEFARSHPSDHDPAERAKIMDDNGLNAAIMFPQLGLFGSGENLRKNSREDLEFQRAVLGAYNDWVLSWPASEPGRFIPLAVIPYWDIEGAIRETERCAELGTKGIVMTGKPQIHGCPLLADPYWNDLWRAAEANDQCVSFHVGGGGSGNGEDLLISKRNELLGPTELSIFFNSYLMLENAKSAVDLLCSRVLQRHPQLNFSIVETGIGWAPFVLEALDEYYVRYVRDAHASGPDELPSDLFRRQVFVNTWFEHGRPDEYPYGNAMFETDYPHPKCLVDEEITDYIDKKLGNLSQEQLEGVLWKNAMRCYHLHPSDVASDEDVARHKNAAKELTLS